MYIFEDYPPIRLKHKFFFISPWLFPCIIKSSIFSPLPLRMFLILLLSTPLVFIILSCLTYSSFSIKKRIFPFIVLELYFLLRSIQFLLLRRLPYLRRQHACFFSTVVKEIPCMPRNYTINISITNFKTGNNVFFRVPFVIIFMTSGVKIVPLFQLS